MEDQYIITFAGI